MKLLTTRTLRVFAVLESYRAGSDDILDAVMLFFEPILSSFNGQIFDPTKFAAAVRQDNKWNFTADVAEGLIPNFLNRSWLVKGTQTKTGAVFQVTCPPTNIDPTVERRLSLISQEFYCFLATISPISAVAYTEEQLGDMIIEWLVSIDAYSEDVLRKHINKFSNQDGRLSVSFEIPEETRLSIDQRYLCARFAKHILDSNSNLIKDLSVIASVGLLTEVVQDFQKPVTRANRSDLIIYLDAPVTLDLLGVSGEAAAQNIRPLIFKLQEIGATVRVMRISVDEMKRALDAVLQRQPTARTGPTADAIRRNEVLEGYVREVARMPEKFLQEGFNIAVLDRTLTQFPNQHEYFDKDTYEAFYSKIGWHIDTNPRDHDATAIALVMRLRSGRSSPDIFEAKHLFVTRSGALSQLSRQFCHEKGLMPSRSVGPAIHQRQLAMAVWLRTGMSKLQDDIPKRYLLAACERVLALQKSVVDQVLSISRSLTPEKASQLELLLTQDRSAQVLMDKTLGVSNVISTTNIESLIDEMKTSLIADVEEEKKSTISKIEEEAKSKIDKANRKRLLVEKEAAIVRSRLSESRRQDRAMIIGLLSHVNRRIAIRRNFGVFSLSAMIVLLPILSSLFFSQLVSIVVSIISGVLLSIALFYQFRDKAVGLGRFYLKSDHETFKQAVRDRGLTEKIKDFRIKYSGNAFEIEPDETPKTGNINFEVPNHND